MITPTALDKTPASGHPTTMQRAVAEPLVGVRLEETPVPAPSRDSCWCAPRSSESAGRTPTPWRDITHSSTARMSLATKPPVS